MIDRNFNAIFQPIPCEVNQVNLRARDYPARGCGETLPIEVLFKLLERQDVQPTELGMVRNSVSLQSVW